jgi:hypothetical protein
VVEAADAVRHRFGERAITRARLVGSRLPAPFERDPMSPVEARGGRAEHVEDKRPNARRSTEGTEDRDSLDDTTEDEDRFDGA